MNKGKVHQGKELFLAILLLAGINFLFFAKVLISPGVFVAGDYGGSDFTDFFLSVKSFLNRSFQEGKLPFWSGQMGTGFPLIGEGQVQAFFPLSLLFFVLPFYRALALTLVLPIFFSGVTFYLFLKTFRLNFLSSLFGAIGFSFSASLILHLKHPPITSTLIFFPLELAVINLFFNRKQKIFLLLLSPIIALKFLAASPQLATLTTFFSGAFFLFKGLTGQVIPQKKALIQTVHLQALLRHTALFSLVCLLGLAMASIQLQPTLDLWPISGRTQTFSVEEMKKFSLIPKSLTTLLIPYSLENPARLPAYFELKKYPFFWETNLYSGIAVALLGLFGFLIIFKKKPLVFFSLSFLVSLLLAFGPNLPTGFVFRLPFFKGFRVPGRFAILSGFSLITAAAFFFDFLFYQQLPRFIRSWSKVIGFLVILFLALDLFYFGYHYNAAVSGQDFDQLPKTVAFLKKVRTTPDRFSDRLFSYDFVQPYNFIFMYNRGWHDRPEVFLSHRELVPPNVNLFYQLPSLGAYAGMELARSLNFEQLATKLIAARHLAEPVSVHRGFLNLMRLSNTKYLFSPFIIDIPGLKKIFSVTSPYHDLNFHIYQVANSLPRVAVVPQAKYFTSPELIQEELIRVGFNSKECVFIEEPNRWGNSTSIFGSFVNILTNEDEKLILEANLTDQGFLVLADAYHPDWKAFVDGQETKILRANLNFRALPLKAGQHRVEFFYQPRHFPRGAKTSLVALVVWVGLFGFSLFKNRTAPRQKTIKKV